MKTSAKRLNQVEAALTPKQQVLRWLEEARRAGSVGAYCRRMFRGPLSEWPGDKLTEAAAEAVRKRLKKQRPEVIWNASRDAVRDVAFLLSLVGEMNRTVAQKVTEFKWVAAHCARGLQLAMIRAEAATAKAADLSRQGPTLLDVRAEILALAAEVSMVRYATALIRRRYFDHKPVLFPDIDSSVTDAVRTVRSLAETYNDLLYDSAATTADKGKRHKAKAPPTPQPIEAYGSRGPSDPATLSFVREQVADAKAHAAWQVGQDEAAVEILGSLNAVRPA